jgi:hypothetical protein
MQRTFAVEQALPEKLRRNVPAATRAMYDRYNIVNEGDISMALTQAEAYRARRGYNLATSEGAQPRGDAVSKV